MIGAYVYKRGVLSISVSLVTNNNQHGSLLLQLLLFPEERGTSSTLSSMDSDSAKIGRRMGIPTTDVPTSLLHVKHWM